MTVVGVDPGPEQSAIVVWDGQRVQIHCTLPNEDALRHFSAAQIVGDIVVFEQVHMGGMPAGIETFETVFWTGRFYQAVTAADRARLRRQAVKMHLCGSMRANDSNIRQALVDRFGPSKALAIGTKHAPGVFYGLKGHEWAALAIAVTWHDNNGGSERKDGRSVAATL